MDAFIANFRWLARFAAQPDVQAGADPGLTDRIALAGEAA